MACEYDTDGDGDCRRCARHGGCLNMDNEQIEKIVESSKRMQEVGEFISSTANDALLDNFTEAVLNVAVAMREQTERDDLEIVSAIVGSVAGILIGWTTEYEDG
jgi:uncharacterized membrane protein YqgA involved in biofilm formation